MEIKEIVTYEYKTKDGKVFRDKDEAYKHECRLIAYEIESEAIEVGEYLVCKIENQQQLTAVVEYVKNNSVATLKSKTNVKEFPYYICRSSDDDDYYEWYEDIDSVLEKHKSIIKKLENIKDNKR